MYNKFFEEKMQETILQLNPTPVYTLGWVDLNPTPVYSKQSHYYCINKSCFGLTNLLFDIEHAQEQIWDWNADVKISYMYHVLGLFVIHTRAFVISQFQFNPSGSTFRW